MPTAVVASSSDSASGWGQPEPAAARRRTVPQPTPVRDDWEDDDDDDDQPSDDTNKKIWDQADSKVPAPMPVLSISSSSSVLPPPPPAAFQPALKILKRPTPAAATNTDSRTPSPGSQGTLKNREARYQEARNRIFGESPAEVDAEPKGIHTATTTITRNPLGPTSQQTDDSETTTTAGFGRPRAQPPPTTTLPK